MKLNNIKLRLNVRHLRTSTLVEFNVTVDTVYDTYNYTKLIELDDFESLFDFCMKEITDVLRKQIKKENKK